MQSFKRFKWVPMLIKAYYDAQRMKETGQLSGDVMDKAITNSTTTKLPHKKPLRPIKPIQNREVRQRQPKAGKPMVMSDSMQRANLLREIRVLKNKLNGLEDIQRQLTRLGVTVEEMKSRMEQATDEQSSDGATRQT